MKFRDCTSMNSTGNIQEGYRYWLSKTALEIESCKQQLFTLTSCLQRACEVKLPGARLITRAQLNSLLTKCDDYQFRRLILQFPALGKKLSYREHVYHNPSSISTPRDVERRESGFMFGETNHFLKFERIN